MYYNVTEATSTAWNFKYFENSLWFWNIFTFCDGINFKVNIWVRQSNFCGEWTIFNDMLFRLNLTTLTQSSFWFDSTPSAFLDL